MPFTTLLSRPMAMVAVITGIIVLCIIAVAAVRAKRRARRRRTAQNLAREIVRAVRRATAKSGKPSEKMKVLDQVRQIDRITRRHGLALHEVGTSRKELEKFAFLVREQTVADPRCRWPNALHLIVNPKEPGTPDIPVNAEIADAATAEPVGAAAAATEAMAPAGETVLCTVTMSVSDVPIAPSAPDGTTVILNHGEEIIVEVEEYIPPDSGPKLSADPMVALRDMNDAELDEFIDRGFDTMSGKDK